MKKLKMLPLVVIAAIAAMAIAVPAVASATAWTGNGNPITSPRTIDLDGTVGFVGATGSLYCDVQGEATLGSGDEGNVTALDTVANSCDGTGGIETDECTLQSASDSLPWNLQASLSGITASDVALELSCLSGTQTFTGDLTLTPDNNSAMSSWDVFGDLDGPIYSIELDGSLDVSPAGTYGINSSTVRGTVLCASADCRSGSYSHGTLVGASASAPGFYMDAFGMSGLAVGCAESNLLGTTTAESYGSYVPASTYLNFINCYLFMSGGRRYSCSVEALNLPYSVAIAKGAGDGRISIYAGSGGAPPALNIDCSGFPVGFDCTFDIADEAEVGSPGALGANLQLYGGSPGAAEAEEVPFGILEEQEGCDSSEGSGVLNAYYELQAPDPLYLGTASL